MAENLVRHKADINHIDNQNQTLLHLAIQRGNKKIIFIYFENFFS